MRVVVFVASVLLVGVVLLLATGSSETTYLDAVSTRLKTKEQSWVRIWRWRCQGKGRKMGAVVCVPCGMQWRWFVGLWTGDFVYRMWYGDGLECVEVGCGVVVKEEGAVKAQ